ncbi:hypothetical protein BCT30_14570 [Enterovibrio norvegicus]|uniref:Uncharacterized protein n=2 Tax=Enterovibrio norvegicus TaxID=188144 RepID=A0A2N7LB58_9GAMM|nr:hypothetical protein [Enterovibrio norvegicus]MCC4798238.1 hypothetical protein [Enterovibrio norvegicus]OEE59513.1 hypothetical protein A1OS_03850 [Enterovibrio norvegicus]OEF48464.1 hypothetical protein A1OW_15115 [Enterovibrio norvegicus]OEF56663.1 hypothetical protein A1OU_18075 [Enterovibrio norvegicus]PMI30468.1 hypothetical protein BCU47_17540 [Enterovibrio norvegicus]
MDSRRHIYNAYFKAKDKFDEDRSAFGYEPDIVQGFVQTGLMLASYHELGAENESVLLNELFLRQVYFKLLDAIQSPYRTHSFRRVCLDGVHSPLYALQRHYVQVPDGERKFAQLQLMLQRLQAPLD